MKTSPISKAIKFALTIGAASILPGHAFAEQTNDIEIKETERIEVSGSRIKRIGELAPTPVTVITGVDLVNAGITNVADLLQKLPSSAAGSTTTNTTNTIFGAGINTTDLRGLGSERTLVLVNGRRFVSASPTDSSVNLNTIPSSIIERIEVVHGGASAVYGSDAVAGVVNIILKESHDGVSVDLSRSQTQQGRGDKNFLNLTYGGEWGNTSLIANFSYSEIGQLRSLDRDFIRNPVTAMRNPKDTGEGDGIPAYVQHDQHTILAFWDKKGDVFLPHGHFTFGPNGELVPFNNGDGPLPAPNDWYYNTGDADGYNFLEEGYLATPLERYNFFSNVNHKINESHSMSFEVAFAKDKSYAESGAVYLTAPIRVDNAFWHQDAKDLFAYWGYPGDTIFPVYKLGRDFGNRKFEDDRDTLNTTLAFEGVIFGDYDYSLYLQRGENTTETRWHGELIESRLAEAIDAVEINGEIVCANRDESGALLGALEGCSPLNLMGLGAASQEALDYVGSTETLDMKKIQTVIGGTLSGYAYELPAGDVLFALSGEYRKEEAESNPSYAISNDLTFNNFVKSWQGEFSVKEVGLEVSVPLLADQFLAKELTVDLAARYMDYSTVGDNTAWKAGFSWSVTDEIRFRGTKSKSVRAPSVSDLFDAGIQSFTPYSDPCDYYNILLDNPDVVDNVKANCKQIGADFDQAWQPSESWRSVTPPSVNGGNPNLQEETSDDTLFGVIYTPTENITFIADYWKFKIDNAVNYLGQQRVVNECYEAPSLNNPSCDLVTRDPETLDITNVVDAPYNIAVWEMEGIDIESVYNLETTFGQFDFRLLATYLKHREFIADVFEEDYNFQPLVGEQESPRWKARFTIGYTYEDLYLLATANYRHATVIDREWTIEQYDYNEISSYIKWDLFARYNATDNVELRAGVNNLFDVTPPRNPNSYNVGEYYDIFGRTFTFGVNVAF
ncbi:TonB-dependent receptor domain-containing protein [Thalassotalea ganghwensis]